MVGHRTGRAMSPASADTSPTGEVARVRIDIRPSAWMVMGLAVMITWTVGFSLVFALAVITLFLERTEIFFDRAQLPLIILALLAGIVAGLVCLTPQTLVIDADGLAVRRIGRRYRIAWNELRLLAVVQGQGLRRASWYLLVDPADATVGDRSRDLRWHRGGLWLSLWSNRAATQAALALQEYASHRYVGVTSSDAVPESPWPGR